MSAPSISTALRSQYDDETARIRVAFDAQGDGRAAVRARAALVDAVAQQLWATFLAPSAESGIALVALGGFGRSVLFPHSDIDLLFLCADQRVEETSRAGIRSFCQEMWDLRLRVSPATRTLDECDRLHQDNLEFTISLLDCRFLAGDQSLFTSLHDQIIPRLVLRERQPIVQRLAELTHTRQHKFGDTIFHLEPNLKNGPGGLRDYNVGCWLTLISTLEKRHGWPRTNLRDEVSRALEFLYATRCFLHYRSGRDDNALTWEAQDAAAEAGIGFGPGTAVPTNEWMRAFFRHARAISRFAAQVLDDVPPARSSLYQGYQQWRSRVSNADFTVANGRVYLQQPDAIRDPELLLRLFTFLARHGFKLSGDAERRIERVLPSVAAAPPSASVFAAHLRELLTLPYAASALRAMHGLELLDLLLPEFHVIDTLVIRDFYHRYTVDEHTFRAIDALHALRTLDGPMEKRYAEMLAEVEQPDLLFLAVLLHDIGKGAPTGTHVEAGLLMLGPILQRLGVSADDSELVRFLIGSHLDMSAAMRRDIFDPRTIAALAEKCDTPARLKMLCLLTYADIKAVNPEALTPWKAEDMWRLYVAAANHLDRNVDRDRVDTQADGAQFLAAVRDVSPERRSYLSALLNGLPRRYLLTHSPEEIAVHGEMASRMAVDPVQLSLTSSRHLHRLTIITRDRPALFATVAGVLAAWGMNIVKADAFSNAAATVVDTFVFADSFRTLELNPSERRRLERHLVETINGERSVEEVMKGRMRAPTRAPKPQGPPRITFDNESSSRSTVLELVSADRPGLLYRVASVLAHHGCDIEIALIDTEGHTAVDVFYITANAAKIDDDTQQALRAAITDELIAD